MASTLSIGCSKFLNCSMNRPSSASRNPRGASRPDGIWSVLGPVWAVWVIFVFVLTMLLVFPIFLLFSYYKKTPENTTRFIRISRVWMGVFLPLAGTPLKIRGREKFAKDQAYVVVCNHNALLDVPITSPGIPG